MRSTTSFRLSRPAHPRWALRLLVRIVPLVLAQVALLGAADDNAAALARERHVHEAAQYVKDRGGAPPHTRASAHFALHWGDIQPKDATIDDAFADRALVWLESLWTTYLVDDHFPAPRHDGKINAYITGTGLKPFLDGYAYGFGDPEGHGVLIGHWSIFKPGHNGAAHEFVHALQAESGGFRDSDYVGSFWETHAQFLSHQATGVSDLPHVLERYAQTAQWDVASTRHHYGSWIFYQYIAERLPDGMALVNRLWTEPRANKDEDAIAKLRRLFPASGDRDTAWADLVGDYAKRNVAWSSYRLGREYRDKLGFFAHPERRNYFTWLEASPTRPGWWRVPRFFAPQQLGYNVIPLRTTADTVTVEFSGFVDAALKSAWRATMVAIDADYHERFSPTWADGAQSFAVKPGEKLYLVVAAAPAVHHPPPFKDDWQTIPYHPYEVRCAGAEPRCSGSRIRPLPTGVAGAPHANGGGFVAASATVEPGAFVGPGAAVLGRAQVRGNARIEDFATIDGEAAISGQAVVAGNALVGDHAHVADQALIDDFAEVTDRAQVSAHARVLGTARVVGQTKVLDEAVVKGHCTTTSVKQVRGGAVLDGDVEWDCQLDDLAAGICFGTLLQPGPWPKPPDNHHLYARWTMERAHSWKLADACGSDDGVLHGGAAVVKDAERGSVLALSGSGQFADVPRDVAWPCQLTIAAWVRLDTARPDQPVAAFVGKDPAHALELSASDAHGHVGLRLAAGGRAVTVTGPQPPLQRWFHLAATFGDGGATLYVDGHAAGHVDEPCHPADVRAVAGFLGRRPDGGFLAGRLDDVSAWTQALSATEIAAEAAPAAGR
jgi:carbonic anhydrase/acetyltransferase-like protein (isoleucine patch superfamily)